MCTSEGSAGLGFRRVIFDDVMSYNSLTTLLFRPPFQYLFGISMVSSGIGMVVRILDMSIKFELSGLQMVP